MKQPKVLIATPSLNSAKYITQTLKSIKAQDYTNLKQVVMDAQSTDDTAKIAKRFKTVTFISEPDTGQANAINKVWKSQKADYITWLNADDIYLDSGAISKAVKILEENPELSFVHANIVEIDNKGQTIRRRKTLNPKLWSITNQGNQIFQPGVLIRASIAKQAGFLDEDYNYAMDYEFWLRLLQTGQAKHVNEYWTAFRIHDESKTVAEGNKFYKEERRASRKYGAAILSDHMLMHHLKDSPRLLRLAHIIKGALNKLLK